MIVILTGAGISKESGLATFRDADGLWADMRVEDVATPGGFRRNPGQVLKFYNDRRRELATVAPNAAHLALARLEAEWPEEVLVVTQNVDDLHDRAGSKALLHMHGELLKARCQACGAILPWTTDFGLEDVCPQCRGQGVLRPHIVWFEEVPLYMDEIERALSRCRTFVSIGTSGNVYPAAGFVRLARHAGAQTVELNLESSQGAASFHTGLYGPATRIVPQWVEETLARRRSGLG
ncbi:MAG: NAD-dependent deacylase [Candidatus Adiutrix sp.]|jgi:NAD-dependent deacetylase|nr:NAD-dependent deacylase [Candidatus Adiutrix sp.]